VEISLPHPSAPKNDLWEHQQIAIQRAKTMDFFAFLFQPGLGKSRTTIEVLRQKFTEHNSILPTLILAPPVVIKNWKDEWVKFSKIKPEKVVPLIGTGKQRLKLLQDSPLDSIWIVNYETFSVKEMKPIIEEFKKRFSTSKLPCVLVADEAHRLKDITAKRTKAVMDIAPLFKYRYLLTGTPVLNDYRDIFSQFYILDLGQRFGKNFYSFKATYFTDLNRHMPKQKYFPNIQLIKGMEEQLKRKMQDCSMFADKLTCLDLPPLLKKTIEVEMGSEQKRLYESMKRDLIATILGEDGKLRASIAELAITKALRLQQICSGHLRVENDNGQTGTLKIKDNPRKQALKELLMDLAIRNKILVWSVFKDNYDDIRQVCRDLDLEFAELHGEITNKEDQIEKFRNDPKVKVLIGNPLSAGLGINLVEASYMIYYSRSFSLEADIQSEARCYRAGSERHTSITRIDIVCRGTIDELVLNALAKKQQLGDRLLRDHLQEI